MSSSAPTISLTDAKRPIYAGIDVGGTNIKIGLVDDEGRTVAFEKITTESPRGPADAVQRMAARLQQMLQTHAIASAELPAVGLATPGSMDIAAGMILEPSNLPAWRHFPIRDALRQACGKPVVYANDAGAAGFGEYWVGSGRQYHSIVLLTLGTGVGGGIIVGDLSIDGEHSHGAECGHNIIDTRDDARLCSCGQKGHLEAYCSATALVKRAQELLDAGRNSSLRSRLAKGETLTTLMMAQEAEREDRLSVELIDEFADYLGLGMVSIAHTVDPAAILLGGAVNFGGRNAALGGRFLSRVREKFQQLAMPVLARETIIDFADLGSNAGYIGAAGLARTWHNKQPPLSA